MRKLLLVLILSGCGKMDQKKPFNPENLCAAEPICVAHTQIIYQSCVDGGYEDCEGVRTFMYELKAGDAMQIPVDTF